MSRAALVLLASALMDGTAYFYFFATAVQARKHGLSESQILLMGAAGCAVYTLGCAATTGISEGRPRHRFVLAGAIGAAAAAAVAAVACGTRAGLFAAFAALYVALSLYWPTLQARLGDLSRDARDLQARLGAFNLSWCAGKATSCWVAGQLLGRGLTVSGAFALAAGSALLVALVATLGTYGPAAPPRPAAPPGEARPLGGFLPAARLANFVCWGGSALLTWAVEKRASDLSLGTSAGGWALGAAFAAEAVTFVTLRSFPGWRYRAAPLIGIQLVGAAGYLLLGFASATPLLCLGAAGAGVGIGMAYFASLFYSLELGASRSRGAGIHESILGSGGVVVPLAGAAAAHATGWGGAPFAVVAALILAGIPVQARLVRAGRG
ncbi:MAG: hypothetical protein L0216_21220 [Planctomycetales bacterium]|nr:hypothetical protein [Planctomycetales bacterium]